MSNKALSLSEIRSRIDTFVADWKDETSENSESQTFWNEFFNCFGINRRRLGSYEKCNGAITAHSAFVSAKPSIDPTARSDYLMHSTIDNERMVQVAFLPVIIQRTTAATA